MSPVEQYKKYLSSFFVSTRFFVSSRFLVKLASRIFHNESDRNTSPTSVLDTKPLSCPTTPTSTTEGKCLGNRIDSEGVGLGIVEAFLDDKTGHSNLNPESPRILFGSQIKAHTPSLPHPSESLESSDTESTNSVETSDDSRLVQGCQLPSASEMVLSEDYTRVISHGPNPKITHIFNDCIVDSSLFDAEFGGSLPDQLGYPSDRFLNFCLYCKKYIGQGADIFMLRHLLIKNLTHFSASHRTRYKEKLNSKHCLNCVVSLCFRGERAFCSRRCRFKGLLLVDEKELLEVAAIRKVDLLRVAAV